MCAMAPQAIHAPQNRDFLAASAVQTSSKLGRVAVKRDVENAQAVGSCEEQAASLHHACMTRCNDATV